MDVSFAFLCDYADNAAKLTAVGIGFDTIYAAKTPARHPLFFAVAAIRFSRVEAGRKRFRVHVTDADGKDIAPPLDTTMDVQPPPEGYLHRTQRIALALHGAEFPRYGDYQVSWLVDGFELVTIPLRVAPPPPGMASSQVSQDPP